MANNNPKKFKTTLSIVIFLVTSTIQAYANEEPIIYNASPQYIQQGQITNVVVNGANLESSIVGINGGDVFVFVLKQSPFTLQFAVQPTAEVGDREFFLRTPEGKEVKYPIQIVPFGAPAIETITPDTISPGSFIAYITGRGLNNSTATTTSNELSIISSLPSSDGTLLIISGTLSSGAIPGSQHSITVSSPGGQTSPIDLTVSSRSNNEELFNPYAPGISSVEIDPVNKNQVILKGSMFDPDPAKNTVTLLENINGTVTGRPVDVVYSNNGEIVINLPENLGTDSISFAVSSLDGKSSNIKTINLDSLHNNETTNTDQNSQVVQNAGQTSPSQTTISTQITQNTQTVPTQPIAIAENNQTITTHKNENTQHETNKQPESPQEKLSNETSHSESIEEIIAPQNIQHLSQYLFSSTPIQREELLSPQVDQIKDPAKIISTLEESKQIKNQAEVIMLALDNVKENKELTEAIKKTEGLKSKVDELEKLLNLEKQKNKPDLRKLAKYEQLLATANAESRSQTFSLLNNLLKYKPQLKNLLTQKPLDLATIQPNIPHDSVILQYVPTEEGLIIFVVDNNNLKIRINKNISKDILNREVQAYRQLFENEIEKIKLTGRVTPIVSWRNDKSNTYKKEIQPLKEKNVFLYNTLIGPIEKDIAAKKVVAIIANGWLRYLPFQSLAKPTKDGDLQFLISEKSIVYLDSVVALSNHANLSLSNLAKITVFANPDGTLAGANKEAEIIASLFNMSTTSLIQKPFNTSLINQLAKKADILHLATHGYLDGTDFESSYLVSGKKSFGKTSLTEKLFLKDIYDLNLQNSKLVVLSGCDTGKIGNLANEPDDIVGSLATAFRVAGANTLLASLWKAHDEATKIIMQSFYENLKTGLNKAEALRRAELKVKNNPKYGHPLFWSLFSLIGDWR